ncbi:MAG: putative protein [Candidatus Erwinia impunctatus]|nr:putative protein [Culicoides impunctatus]
MRRKERHHIEGRLTSAERQPLSHGVGRFRIPRGKGGVILLLLVMIAGYYIQDFTGPTRSAREVSAASVATAQQTDNTQNDEAQKLTSALFDTVQASWKTIFQQAGNTWKPVGLVMYRDRPQPECTDNQSDSGSFYCASTATIYMDLSFYDQLHDQPIADSEFALGYLIARQVAYHVQHLLGIDSALKQIQENATPALKTEISNQAEWQRDCFVGIWASDMAVQNRVTWQNLASVIQMITRSGNQGMGEATPIANHSDAEYYWFKKGVEQGDPGKCDSFQNPR